MQKTLSFGIEGEWFTWMLRHLWVEGSEIKAIKMWQAAFPKLSDIKCLKTFFIDVVSGRKKFVGMNSFSLEEDNTKYWSTVAGGEPNKEFSLLDSWEDVILLKKVKLFIKEIYLRDFRLSRKYGNTYFENGCNIFNWSRAGEENNIENSIREDVDNFYTDILNISKLLELDNIGFEFLPPSNKLNTRTWRGRITFGNSNIKSGLELFTKVINVIVPYKEYFKNKYGNDMIFINEDSLKTIFGCDSETVRMFKEKEINKFQNDMVQQKVSSIIPSLDLDNYIQNMVNESKREKIEVEDVSTTKYQSGYIDREGRFYGCADFNHVKFADGLCDMSKVKGRTEKDFDAQIYLDNIGWIKVSVNRFYWDKEPNEFQIKTIYNYITTKNIDKTIYNRIGCYQTFQEAFKEGEKT